MRQIEDRFRQKGASHVASIMSRPPSATPYLDKPIQSHQRHSAHKFLHPLAQWAQFPFQARKQLALQDLSECCPVAVSCSWGGLSIAFLFGRKYSIGIPPLSKTF